MAGAELDVSIVLPNLKEQCDILGAVNRITINPRVRFGKPCIRGTRIAVVDILNLFSAGYAADEIPKQLPGIRRKDVLAALEFATSLTEQPTKVFTQANAAK